MVLTNENYVDIAEEVVGRLERDERGNFLLTKTKIRKLLSLISVIYDDVIHLPEGELTDDMNERVQYLRIRFAYEAGREKSVKNLVEVGEILELIKSIGRDKEKCIRFCRYMEAIVAYHKYYGGRD